MKITARALIFNSQKKLLTVQHHGSDFWALAGGKVDEGEDLKTCLKREISEELGIECTIKNLAFVHEFRWSPESDVTTEFFFLVEISEENISEFSGKFTEQELKKISWETLDKDLNIKPEFLRNFNANMLLEKDSPEYFSYT